MSYDENTFENDKRTGRRSEVRTKIVYFMHKNYRRLNQGWKASLSSVVEAETTSCFWRRNLKVQLV